MGKLSSSSVIDTDRADRVSLWAGLSSCSMMMMAAPANESPNKSTEDKTSSRRQNEGKTTTSFHLQYAISLIQTHACLRTLLWLSDQMQ